MKNAINKFKELSLKNKAMLITALVFTALFVAAIPVYAWFSNQKKAAEMFKVQYPNALYINAAHREDQVNFNLAGININEYKVDENGKVIVEMIDGKEKPVKITEERYVFSVSGTNTEHFLLQMAHTNNNLFKYKLYYADEQLTKPASDKVYVEYKATDEHNENKMVFADDTVTTDMPLYYVKGKEVQGNYLNMDSGAYVAKFSPDNYYKKTYGENTNVEAHAVPSYWQATNIPANSNSNKQFCRYFILEVTWDNTQQSNQTDKETDLVYFSVERVD